jgi:hypothetical protein
MQSADQKIEQRRVNDGYIDDVDNLADAPSTNRAPECIERGNQGNQSPIYHYAIGVCARFSGFQIYINFDFSNKTDKVMAEHNKVVWGVVPDLGLGPYLESC